jgi:hypothetical protein
MIRDEEEEQQSEISQDREEAVGQVALRFVRADAVVIPSGKTFGQRMSRLIIAKVSRRRRVVYELL